MLTSLAASRTSKAKGWILVILTVVVLVTVFVVFDLGSQFRLRKVAHDVASAASQAIQRRPAPRPNYPMVRDGQADRTSTVP